MSWNQYDKDMEYHGEYLVDIINKYDEYERLRDIYERFGRNRKYSYHFAIHLLLFVKILHAEATFLCVASLENADTFLMLR